MKVAIFVTNPKDSYSGGRYLSLVLAECLASRGHKVYYITNKKPIFFNDFEIYENHKEIDLIITNDFSIKPMETKFDFVVLIPHQNPAAHFYDRARNFALLTDANLILFNFETPNWFNKYSPVKRNEKMWFQWKKCCEQGCLVLSMTKESQKYATLYYTDYPEQTYFEFWYPAINSLAADRVPVTKKEKRVLAISRMEDKHKGSEDILEIMDPTLSGYTVVFILGRGNINDKYREKLEYIKKEFNIDYEIKYKLRDEEKFEEIKKARLLLFPSYFEGYGYPPVEALYCGTLCIAYDLPVLRETCKNGIFLVKTGDIDDFRAKIKQALALNHDPNQLKSNILDIGNFQTRALQLEKILLKYAGVNFNTKIVSNYKPNILKKYLSFLKRKRCKVNIGQFFIHNNKIGIKGWLYSHQVISGLRILINGKIEIGVDFPQKRPDVLQKHQELTNIDCGFYILDIIEAPSDIRFLTFCFYSQNIVIETQDIPINNLKRSNNEDCFYDDTLKYDLDEVKYNSELRINGWVYADAKIDSVSFFMEEKFLGKLPVDKNRQDVVNQFDGCAYQDCGFSGQVSLFTPSVFNLKLKFYSLGVPVAITQRKINLNLEYPLFTIGTYQNNSYWLTLKADDSTEMHQRVELANCGRGLTENDRRIGALKDKHKNEIAFLLGNGPSVRFEDLERLQNSVTFGCNRMYLAYDKMKFRPTYLCSTDQQMIEDFGAEMVEKHPGTVLFISEQPPAIPGEFAWFKMKSRTPLEFSENVYDFVMPGGGTLIAAIQIGYHMGITKFVLYGVDHSFNYQENKNAKGVWDSATGDGNHFIPNYRSGKPWARPVKFQVEGAFLSCHVFLQAKGGWVKNATRGGNLEVLERIDFDQIAPK